MKLEPRILTLCCSLRGRSARRGQGPKLATRLWEILQCRLGPVVAVPSQNDSSPRDPKQGERGKIDTFNKIRPNFRFFAKMELGASR